MNYSIDLSSFSIVNDLFNDFVNKYGFSRSKLAFQQCINLQKMQGTENTLPVLIWETCGTGLIDIDIVKKYTGLNLNSYKFVLLFSSKFKSIQIVQNS